MKTGISILTFALVVAATPMEKRAQPKGIDVSSHQGNVDWTAQKNAGYTFAYIKATEGTGECRPLLFSGHKTQTSTLSAI